MSGRRIGTIVLLVSLIVVIASVLYTNNLARQLAVEEQKKMELWAEATRQFILADEGTDIDFVTSIIEDNNTIPVYMVDKEGNIIMSRNADEGLTDPTGLHGPIEVKISDDIQQYIYYDDSTLLKQLVYFPYIQFALIFLFILIGVVTLYTAQRSEQDRVWAGLSKETAHQLGTPISSLNAWLELLKTTYPNDELLPQMQRDIDRLQMIAERFSKVGSEPELSKADVESVLTSSVSYMRTRTSNKVSYQIESIKTEEKLSAMLSIPLFDWVIENLIKNAIDAMNGEGFILLTLSHSANEIYIDVTDTGKGISRRNQKQIFCPGFTTKQRGWGLGLSLSKRIVEDYHGGKLLLKSSEIGVGTTFRIVLKKSKDC